MLNPEEFKQQLERELAKSQEGDREKRVAEISRQQQMETENQAKEKRAKTEGGEKNQRVLEWDAQLPIGRYFKILKDKIAPEQNVKRWGPRHGEMAYTLIFRKAEMEIAINTEDFMGGGRTPPSSKVFKEKRKTNDVLGLVLKDSGLARLGIWRYAEKGEKEGKFYPESENPWDFRKKHSMLAKDRGFLLSNSEECARLAQALTDFYLAFEAGQAEKAFRPLNG